MPKTGLNVPVVTVLDSTGEIIESDQRRVISYVIQNGRGASSVFLSGTTGEFNCISNQQRQQLIEIGCDEIRRCNARIAHQGARVEAWAGVSAPTTAETLENLQHAINHKADMAVIAPLAIADLAINDIIRFFENDVAAVVAGNSDKSFSVSLYDNPDIAVASESVRNIPSAFVETLSRLPFMVGIKASTTREVLREYIRVHDTNKSFDVYVGSANLIFDAEAISHEADFDRHSRVGVAGVVAGPANLMPREWRAAWEAVVKRDTVATEKYKQLFARFNDLCVFGEQPKQGVKGIACIKQALFEQDIISSPHVAVGTSQLNAEEIKSFREKLKWVLADASISSKLETKQSA